MIDSESESRVSLSKRYVNRASEAWVTAEGKAVNVSWAVTVLDGDALLVTFLGGGSGRFIARKLDEEDVPHEAIWVQDDVPTRVCTILVSHGNPLTELVEEAQAVSAIDGCKELCEALKTPLSRVDGRIAPVLTNKM